MTSTAIIFFLIVVGFTIGKFSSNKSLFKNNDLFVNVLLYLLLFVFGVSFGLESELFSQMGQMGLEILILTSSAILGSLLFSWFAWMFYRRMSRNEK